jgi:putative flippase GtrA
MSNRDRFLAFTRFVIVGGSFSLAYAVTTAGLIRFAGAPPLFTSIVVYLICIPLAFQAQKNFAFRAERTGRNAMWIYAATQMGSLTVVATITSLFVTKTFLFDTMLYLVSAGTASVVSYLICSFIIFKAPPE